MNKCGDCTECCFVMGVEALNKAQYQKCEHICKGCTIYDQRPDSCKSFNCTWLLSGWSEEFKPSIVGLLVFSTLSGTYIMETRKGAHLEERAQELIAKVQGKTPVKLVVL